VSSDVPQFATAEYSNKAAETVCKACAQKISGPYYRVNGVPACASCAQRLKEQLPQDSHQAFVRAVLLGIGGAIVGFGIYVAFALSTGWMVGYISLLVGYLVGKAVAFGSGGVGGRRYQVVAVLLTYMAVSLAAVPIAISQHMKARSAQQHTQVHDASAQGSAQAQASGPGTAPAPKKSVAETIGVLVLLGLASPFLEMVEPLHGIIGLIILLVGVQIAWKITAARKLDIAGPISEPAAATPG
jgi:uncharacterized protein (DUF983 family)